MMLLTLSVSATNFATHFANIAGGQLNLSIQEMLKSMGVIALGVVIILLVMSIYSIAVMIERYLTFKSAARQSREFVPRVSEMLRSDQLEEALKLSKEYHRSHLAIVVNSGLQELATMNANSNQSRMLRKAKRAVRRATAMKTADFQRGLSSLATIGSTAPFVGLFGTVVGIINAFTKMNEAQESGLSVVAGGISEALVTTAFGLVVAIPAVWMFNYFSNRVHIFGVEMSNSAEELIDHFLEQHAASINRKAELLSE
ncbi:MAG TPA: MotA/TolQ/ExbB proton channel family protein [Blastocatellia bacterium]|nr:MotA/TolQ/ExbB proton channel family protein [Blastocatellia bacterium]